MSLISKYGQTTRGGDYRIMTLVLALKCIVNDKEAVMVCSDSKATYGGRLAYKVRKVFPIVVKPGTGKLKHLALAAGAGSVSMIRHAIRLAEREFVGSAETRWKAKSPSFGQFENAVEQIERKLMARFLEWKENKLEIDVGMILCGVDHSGKASIYVFDETGLATPVHDTPGFACIGSGFVTGGNMILQQFWRPRLKEDEALMLAGYTIQTVSRVDTSVGSFERESWLFRYEDGEPVLGRLKADYFEKYLERIRGREALLKLSWDACDTMGEKELEDVLKKMLRKEE